MRLVAEKLFVQPVSHDNRSGHLTARGLLEVESVGRDLIARELGERIIILTSNLVPAEQTAALLGDELVANGHDVDVFSNAWLRLAGEEPRAVKSLDGFLGGMVTMANCSVEEVESLLVVTHSPLIRAASGLPDDMVLPLESVTRVEAWENSNFRSEVSAQVFGIYTAPEITRH